MRRIAPMIIILLLALVPAVLLAQDDITLESLAETLTALTGRVDGLQERIEFIESMWIGPGAIELEDGSCRVAGDGNMQNETLLKYKDTYGEWGPAEQMRVASIDLGTEGRMVITYAYSLTYERIEEVWNGCEFVSSGSWYSLDWEGNRQPPNVD